MAIAPPLLVADGVRKHFGGVHALSDARLEIEAGEIHGLVGENGSGKSTLLRVISGQLRPDGGRILLDGAEGLASDPSSALAHGIAIVTQETSIVPDLSVAENIFLGRRMARAWHGIDWPATRRAARELLDRLGLELDPAATVGELRPDGQQMVEIARALSFDARLLILDEPTSSLPDDAVGALFDTIRRLKQAGVATLFVSHRLAELFAIVDRVTVLRDGVTVGSGPISEYDEDRLIHQMVGRAPESFVATGSPAASGEPLLEVRGLSLADRVQDVNFAVEPGEVLGLAGLVGAGRSELLASLFGLRVGVEGEVRLAGEPVRHESPSDAMSDGIAYIPADRKRFGAVLDMSVQENLMMACTSTVGRLRRPSRSAERKVVDETMRGLRVRSSSPKAAVATLSGGNQQKVVLGKWLATHPRVLLMDEPTRGVDVGSKAEIHRLLADASRRGIAIVISSSETPELLLLCDRILVMFRGRVSAALPREEASEERITSFATGHRA